MNLAGSPLSMPGFIKIGKVRTLKYDLPQTDKVLEFSYDMKMSPDFETEDFQHIGHVIATP